MEIFEVFPAMIRLMAASRIIESVILKKTLLVISAGQTILRPLVQEHIMHPEHWSIEKRDFE